MALYLQLICPAGASLQMTGGHNLFCIYALVICDHCPHPSLPPPRRNIEDFDFKSAVPHSNQHTVGTTSWQNHDSSPLQSVIILHCHGCLCLSNTYISSALKSQHICQAIPALLRGLGEAVVTNDWCIIYSL